MGFGFYMTNKKHHGKAKYILNFGVGKYFISFGIFEKITNKQMVNILVKNKR